MSNYNIRDIPPDLHKKAKEVAKIQRRTLRQFIFIALEKEIARSNKNTK